ncbi:MAG: hypothetical protein JXB32_08355, partial [Deltaproteobacteria bacterium]|nr:hypothetical protein [Deltaproteobacteria bacterium]
VALWRVRRGGKLRAVLVGLAVAVLAAALGSLASLGALPAEVAIPVLQYWYILAGALAVVAVAAASAYQKLDQRVRRALDARLQDVAPRTPLHVRPPWELLIDAARRVGKDDFGEFKAAFCQELDPLGVDEAVELVWRQDGPGEAAPPGASLAALGALARAAKLPGARPAAGVVAPASPGPRLRVTEAGLPRRKRPAGDDILDAPDEEGDGGDGADSGPVETGSGAVAIDWSAALKGR